jgi:hypothetical protein
LLEYSQKEDLELYLDEELQHGLPKNEGRSEAMLIETNSLPMTLN